MQTTRNRPVEDAFDQGLQRRRLASGLRVVISPAPHSHIISAALAIEVGFRSETQTASGLAHLVEHLQCGAQTEAAKILSAVGGTCNAVTQPDCTLYFGDVPQAQGPALLARLADILDPPAVTGERIAHEIDIITSEIAAAIDGSAMGGFPWLWLPTVLYDDPHLAHNGYGDLSSLSRATAAGVQDFLSRHYRPAAAVLTVVCPDPDSVIPLIDDAFAGLRARPLSTTPVAFKADRAPVRPPLLIHSPEQSHQAMALGWRLPTGPFDTGYLAATLLGEILVGPDDGVLEESLDDVLDVAAYVGPFADPWDVAAPTPFVVEIHEDRIDVPGRCSEVRQILRRCAESRNDTTVRMVADQVILELLERWDVPAARAKLLATGELLHGGTEQLGQAAARLTRVGPDDIATVARHLSEATPRILLRGPDLSPTTYTEAARA